MSVMTLFKILTTKSTQMGPGVPNLQNYTGRAFIENDFSRWLFSVGIPCHKIMNNYHGWINGIKERVKNNGQNATLLIYKAKKIFFNFLRPNNWKTIYKWGYPQNETLMTNLCGFWIGKGRVKFFYHSIYPSFSINARLVYYNFWLNGNGTMFVR